LIEGFLLSCKVENKSPATVSFYKNILERFQCFAIRLSSVIIYLRARTPVLFDIFTALEGSRQAALGEAVA